MLNLDKVKFGIEAKALRKQASKRPDKKADKDKLFMPYLFSRSEGGFGP